MNYIFVVEKNVCFICIDYGAYVEFVGWVDMTDGAWTPHYCDGVRWLPINDAIKALEEQK